MINIKDMKEIEYLQVNHEEIPVQKTFEIDRKNYIFRFNYNDRFDFYTYSIVNEEGDVLYSAKLTYMCESVSPTAEGITMMRNLVPLNIADAQQSVPSFDRISAANFDSIRICVI